MNAHNKIQIDDVYVSLQIFNRVKLSIFLLKNYKSQILFQIIFKGFLSSLHEIILCIKLNMKIVILNIGLGLTITAIIFFLYNIEFRVIYNFFQSQF